MRELSPTNSIGRGINRAEIKDGWEKSIYERNIAKDDKNCSCVFISHRSTDKKAAAAIARYIRECGIDVYIDIDDQGLQLADMKNDSVGIVNQIHEGLRLSTHLLALISEDTNESWWVPYEIGFANSSQKSIASMMLTNSELESFPDYLKIVKRLFSISDFIQFVNEIKMSQSRYGAIFAAEHPVKLPDYEELSRYIKNVENSSIPKIK